MSPPPSQNSATRRGRGRAEAARPVAPSRLALVRYSGELTTKAPPTRLRFSKKLAENLKNALRQEGIRSRIERRHNRLYVHFEEPAAPLSLARVFGVQSISFVEERPWSSVDDVVRQGVELFGDVVEGKTFAIRARRVGDRERIPAHSAEIQMRLGAELDKRALRVDLDNPEVEVHVELAPANVHFFRDTVQGPGGLPLGVEGRAVALVSGGFDSAVAAWQLLKRGVGLDYVFCNLGGKTHQLGTLRVMKHVADYWSYGAMPHFHAVDFDLVSEDLQANSSTRYWQIVLKRLMLRAGTAVAEERGAAALITGEAIGQVSSQTLQNIAVISQATELPILRPLVGMNKNEIIAIAEHIGTFEYSKVVGEYCALVPSKPATNARLGTILKEEQGLDASLVERAVAERSVFDLRNLDLDAMEDPALQVDSIADDATVIDLRSKAAFESWHYPGALFLDFSNALRAYPSFDAKQNYVLYCEFGLKSSHLAEQMRAQGLRAASYKGGSGTLRKLSLSQKK